MRGLALAAVFALLLSGCVGPSDLITDDTATGLDQVVAQAPTGPDAGAPASHAAPTRDESTVTVRPEGGQFVARKTVTLSNDFGGASRADVDVSTFNGAVKAKVGGTGGYQFTVDLYARGQTEEMARDGLAAMAVEFTDSLAGGKLDLDLQVTADPVASVLLPTISTVSRGASVAAVLPAEPSFGLAAETTNGAIEVDGLQGSALDLETTNGAISATGNWDAASAQTTNGALALKGNIKRASASSTNGAIRLEGTFDDVDAQTTNDGIHLDGTFNDVQAATTNGGIQADLESTRTSSQSFTSTNAGIQVQHKAAPDRGFDATAQTTNGKATVTLPGASDEGTRAHATTPGFAQKAVRVTIDATSTNGSVGIVAS